MGAAGRGFDRRTGVVAAVAAALVALGGAAQPGGPAGAAPAAVLPHAAGAPPGHTGGFGEPTCRTCHSEYALNLDGRLTVEGLPDAYEPGSEYAVTLVLESEGMERAGFQGAFRFAGGDLEGRAAGGVEGGDAVAVVPSTGGATYIGHAPGALDTGGSPTASWTFTWTAPPAGAGPVVLHVAANSANGDNSPFGDIVYTLADTIPGPPAKSR